MIRIERDAVATPRSLQKDLDPKSKGEVEIEKASRYYKRNPDGANYSFRAYKGEDVKLALEKLFRGKCAYCESVYASIQPMDVEHWRPKGAIDRLDDNGIPHIRKPGYYWLAADWNNLLPSCIDCNRQRKHLDLGATPLLSQQNANQPFQYSVDEKDLPAKTVEEIGRRRKLGKQNLFPVAENRYAASLEDLPQENPLLLNPCEHFPEDYLRYTDKAIALPQRGLEGWKLQRAENSILIYGLNRSQLVYERREHMLEIKARLYSLNWLAEAFSILDHKKKEATSEQSSKFDESDERVMRIIEDLIYHEMESIRRYLLPHRPFTGMTRQIISVHMDKFNT